MMWGQPTEEQGEALRPYISEREVWDICAGTGELSIWLKQLGAGRVVALDKTEMTKDRIDELHRHDVGFIHSYLHEVPPFPAEVAFLSWPPTYATGIGEWCEEVPLLVYLGSNCNGIICGHDFFWDAMRYREVLTCIPDPRNTMIVYGPHQTKARNREQMMYEEKAAISRHEGVWPYYHTLKTERGHGNV